MPTLSKSRYLDGLQCPKLLWTRYNRGESLGTPDSMRNHLFAMGDRVGSAAQELCPGGIVVPRSGGIANAALMTGKLLDQRVPLFDAAFLAGGRHCRVDILEPAPDGMWNLVEVKAGAKVRSLTIQDVAFQRETLLLAGLKLDRMIVMHVNSRYVREGDLDLDQLFHRVDVTERVEQVAPYVAKSIDTLLETVQGPDPDTPIGSHCREPRKCPLMAQCWHDLPENNVAQLHSAGRAAFEMMDEGLFRIIDVPDSRLTGKQRVQKAAVVSGEPQVDRPAVLAWLAKLEYPLWHLDFETMAPAIPDFSGVRPYQQTAFQFSVHVQRAPGADPEHREFLYTGPGDPRPAVISALLTAIDGKEGTVLAWNTDYEKMVLNDLAEFDAARAPQLAQIAGRLLDLATCFRKFNLYHPDQGGTYSLKAVLPALTDLDHGDLSIGSGGGATHAYEATREPGCDPDVREQVFTDLREYCRLDTLAMVEILRWVEAQVS